GDAINYTQCNSLIGANLNKIRTESKTTAAEVGVYLGVDADFIYRVELGIAELNCHQLYKLSHFFNVKTHNFFEGNNPRAKVDPTADYEREEIAERVSKLPGDAVFTILRMIKTMHPEPKDKERKRLRFED
ncbi:MAG: helix-turn-helix domain-containing protein, partial [Defluviitaleaceae bacterium]|nr:helix-turn-helix domain-containing protein [Defluviitaleaceae bacterium]